jgi:ABC-type Mn2+/Zn2+ transport system ATPase subunit
MTPALYDEILQRLLDDDTVDPVVAGLVDAACRGAAELDGELVALQGCEITRTGKATPSPRVEPAGAYLRGIELSGFRGIGPTRRLELDPGPGLTLLVGRNGSGKSSFAEALETLLIGESRRWAERPKEWQQGWKNLHSTDGAFVEATFCIDGSDPIVVRRIWKEGMDLHQSELRVRRGSDRLPDLEAIGWPDALTTFRPFLSYSDLGAVVAEPSKLYDQLKIILGLEEVSAAIKLLGAARKLRDDRKKDVAERLAALRADLSALDDPRAARCREALAGRDWDLRAIEEVVFGAPASADDDETTKLRRLAQLDGPDLEAVQQAVSALRAALAAQAELAGTGAEQSARLAELLGAALAHVEAEGGPCPVCRAELEPDWSQQARVRIESARAQAAQAREAASTVTRCRAALRHLITPVPAVLRDAAALGLPGAVLEAWQWWSQAPEDARALCEHAEAHAVDLRAAVDSLRESAERRLDSLEAAWRPLARRVGAWLGGARDVQTDAPALRALKKAEKWLKDAEATLRDRRFEPIATRSQEVWTLLRQKSSVHLAGIKLEGTANRRRVALDVTVDGKEGVAVGVMSQGELNALALSLFLPRVTLPESPFRFVVVDDPVQAMDPLKVDGLARVLAEVARRRQVLVLTHDTRLTEAVRRLGIEATIIEVERRDRSVVELRTVLDPVERHFADAESCVRHEDKIGPRLAARTVPGFCRLALEAACTEAVRKRRLGRGDDHAEVERALEDARKLHELAALAIEDDATATARVYSFLNNKHGRWAGDAFRAIQEGVHHGFEGSLRDLLQSARKLATTLREVR